VPGDCPPKTLLRIGHEVWSTRAGDLAMSDQYGPAEASFCEVGARLVAKYGWPVARPHLYCRVIAFVFFQWDTGDETCLARLECYGHASPDPHSGLPRVDLSVHSEVLILAEDLKRRVLAVPCNPTLKDEAHRRKLVRQLSRACGASATGLVGYRNQVTRELEARERLAKYDAAVAANTTRIVLGSSAVDECIM
jgi:hypothetical protein